MSYKRTEELLSKILDAAAESVAEASDEEIIEDMKTRGEDPIAAAEEVRAVLLRGMAAHKKAIRERLKKMHEEEVAKIRRGTATLPGTPSERRTLLQNVFRRNPGYRQGLTLQFRGLSELADDDVWQLLLQLAELGALDDPNIAAEKK